jgi:hypothetical protein
MRVGDLIENNDWAPASSVAFLLQYVAKIGAVERVDFDDQALVRGIACYKPCKVRDVGIADGERGGQVELTDCLARTPDALDAPFRIAECGEDGVAAPETDALALG